MCNCTLIPVTSSRQCESFIRQSKNIECLLEEHLQVKVKGLLNLDVHKTPHILLYIVFPIDMFMVFYCLDISCRRITHIFLFIEILRKKFLNEILVRKSQYIMIRGKFRTLSNISHGVFVWQKSTAKSCYIFLQKSLS